MENKHKPATVLSGTAIPDASKNVTTKPSDAGSTNMVELKVAPDLDTKVSDSEAQRKTAVWVEIFYAFAFILVGLILAIYAIVWMKDPSSITAAPDTSHGGVDPGHASERTINGMFAMGITGIALIVWGIISTALAAIMQIKNRTNHKINNALGALNWITLNPYSWSLVRQSNGYLSKKQKAKIAKKAAAANSDDSVDVKADVQEDEQAATQEIA